MLKKLLRTCRCHGSGPILAVMLMSILSGPKNIQGEVVEYVIAEGVLRPINKLPGVLLNRNCTLTYNCFVYF